MTIPINHPFRHRILRRINGMEGEFVILDAK